MNVSCVTLGIVFLLFLGQLLAQATMNSSLNVDMINMDPENPTDTTALGPNRNNTPNVWIIKKNNKKPKPTP